MIHTHLGNSRTLWNQRASWNRDYMFKRLMESRNLFNIQTLEYDLMAVSTTDLNPSGGYLLAGLSNGSVDFAYVQDGNLGTLDSIYRLNLSSVNLHRVQWNPGGEFFFSMLNNHNLWFVDPNKMRPIDNYNFKMKTTWSEWNPNDRKIIAVCGSESQVRLVDIQSGSSAQTIVLGAPSRLASHRATRCLWSTLDTNCLIVGDNEGYLHVYDTRHCTRPHLCVGEERGQISGMSFTTDQNKIITSQGTENHLVEWTYDKCSLVAHPTKFKKRKKEVTSVEVASSIPSSSTGSSGGKSGKALDKKASTLTNKRSKRIIPLPVDAYIRCQFYVTDHHIYCPVPARVKKAKELYVYDITSGERIKTLKSDEILCQGVYSVCGLLPESLVLYVGGRNRLRVWTIDEDHQRKLEEKMKKYHTSTWDSDDEL